MRHKTAEGSWAATCTATGNNHYICQECGDCEKDETIPKKGHAISSSTYSGPWCTSPRGANFWCTRDGCTYTSSASYGAPYGAHSWAGSPAYQKDSNNHILKCQNRLYPVYGWETMDDGSKVWVVIGEKKCEYPKNVNHVQHMWKSGCCQINIHCDACGYDGVVSGQKDHHGALTPSHTTTQYRWKCHCGSIRISFNKPSTSTSGSSGSSGGGGGR